jgi:putative oxidoreductase
MGEVAGVEKVMETSNAQLLAAKAPSIILWRLLAILIGALFVYAGVLKAWDPIRFAGEIENYHILPWWLGVRLAFYLPWLEILCGFALIFRRLYSGALVLVLLLVLVFIGASVAAKMRGIDISCGCFGRVSDQLSFTWHLVLDFLILAGLCGLLLRTRVTPDNTCPQGPAPA